MCKEDIRLGRAAQTSRTYGTTVPTTGTLIFPANPNRYSLSGAIGYASPITRDISAMLAARVGDVYVPLITFSADHQGANITIMEVGQILTYPIHYVTTGGEIPTALYAGDTAFIEELEDV